MVLSEMQILRKMTEEDLDKRLTITPIIDVEEQFQPTSVDLRLGTEFMVVRNARFEFLDLLKSPDEAKLEAGRYIEYIRIRPDGRFVLHPREFALACTLEYVRLPRGIAGRLEGKSTWGRVGLQIHSTAGFVDPGFRGSLTYELQNVGKAPIPLFPGLRLAQISFYETEETYIPYTKKAYHHYAGRPGLIGSLYYKMSDFNQLRRIHAANTAPEGNSPEEDSESTAVQKVKD